MSTIRKSDIKKKMRNLAASFLALSFVTFAPRAGASDATTAVPGQSAALSQDEKIFYITNRLLKAEKKLFTFERSDELQYGVRDIKLTMHDAGKTAYFGKRAVSSTDMKEDDFFKQLADEQHQKNTKQVIVYVHGYDCSIDVASRVAARMGHEMQLPVVLFSWPSRRNPLTYTADECNAEWSSFQLSDVLQDIATKLGPNNLILVGHSMGCRILCWSLQHSKAMGELPPGKFRHIFLCSPDMDAQVFQKYSPIFTATSEDTRVFASYKDVRLIISKLLHGNIRLGSLDSAKKNEPIKIATDNSIQTIDYTDDDPTVFGHAIPYHLLRQAVQPAATATK